MSEADRIAFMEQRDGVPAAREFAEQTLQVYRSAARPDRSGKKGFAHDIRFRASFVESLLYLRAYLRR